MTELTTPSTTIVANTPANAIASGRPAASDAAEHDRHDDERDRQREELGTLRVLLRAFGELLVDQQLAADEDLRRVDRPQRRLDGFDRVLFLAVGQRPGASSTADRRSLRRRRSGRACTDATPGTASTSRDRRVGDTAPSTIATIDDPDGSELVKPSSDLFGLERLRTVEVPSSDENNVPAGGEADDRSTSAHVSDDERAGRRSERAVRRRSMPDRALVRARRRRAAVAISRVHPGYGPTMPASYA